MQTKVLIILPTDKFLHRQILEGILAYSREHGPWQFHFETGERYEQGLGNGRRWGCAGIIALPRERHQVTRILQSRIPTVLINPPLPRGMRPALPPQSHVTYVLRNQEDVGRTAANFFLERGFTDFAFVGTPEKASWCERRRLGFAARLKEANFGCTFFKGAPEGVRANFDQEAVYLKAWLRSLKPGTALYTVRDRRALQILGLCLELGITVPDTIAVLGTDNDEVLCETATPSLSSIALDGQNAGRLCARLLDQHMHRQKVEPLVDLAYPRVVSRLSTDASQVADPFIARALAIVRADLSMRQSIRNIAEVLGLSERSLEMKARRTLGTTFKTEVNRIRLNEAVRLISNSDLPLQRIAEKCGYCNASHLGLAFRNAFGHSPSVFRYQDPK